MTDGAIATSDFYRFVHQYVNAYREKRIQDKLHACMLHLVKNLQARQANEEFISRQLIMQANTLAGS